MIYVGHFSCGAIQMRDPDQEWHGHFTLIADAKDVNGALRTFRKLIVRMHRKGGLENVEEIYLDTCVELPSIPKSGLMTWLAFLEGANLGGISAALPIGSRGEAALYRWGPQPEPHDGETVDEPFLVLPRAHKRTRKPSPPGTPSSAIH